MAVPSANIDILDLGSKSWTHATLSQARYGLAGASLRHIAMFFGGLAASSVVSDKVDIYNNATNTWTSTTISKPRFRGAATGVGDVIIFAGGRDNYNGDLSEIDIYNIVTETWSTASLSQGRHGIAAASVGTVALFAGGGTPYQCKPKFNCNRDSGYSDRVDLYNSADGTWSTASLSVARSFPASAVHGTKAFIGGGDIPAQPYESAVVDIYDSVTGTWTATAFSYGHSNMCAAASGKAVIFFGGSSRQQGNPSDTIYIYNVEAGVWTEDTSVMARFASAAVTVGDYAIVAGGVDSSDTDVVEVFKFETQVNVYATVSASSSSGSMSGRYKIPARVEPLKVNVSLPTAPTQATDHASGDKWTFQCNTTFDGKLNEKLVLSTLEPLCIATNGLCPISKYSTRTGLASDITNCLKCPPLTTTAAVGSTRLSDCKCKVGYTGPDAGSCSACSQGKYKDAIGSGECTVCPNGKFSSIVSGNVSSVCLNCPSDSWSPSGSTLLEHCVCNVGYTGQDPESCLACVAGKFKAVNGTAECTQCAAGKYSSSTGSTSDACINCNRNTFSAADNSQCTLCPSNAISPMSSATQTACKCDLGYTGPDGDTCIACVAGKFKPSNGSAECTQCDSGKYLSSTAAGSIAECLVCGINTYSSADSSQCVQCPSHTLSAASSSSQADCKCNGGYSGPDGGACVACAVGKFKLTNGSSDCTLCAAGKFWGSQGATSDVCEQCPRNSTSPGGSNVVTDCLCEPGTTGIAHTDSCVPCESGKFKSTTGSADCMLCDAGKFSISGLSICTKCPEGGTSRVGSRDVNGCKCNLGYTGPPGVACEACVAGKYKNINGTSSCVQCPVNATSAIASYSLTHCVCLAGHTGPDGSICSGCMEGDYKRDTGSAPCANCPAGYISTQSATTACASCTPGKFSSLTRRSCISCPAHTTSIIPSTRIQDCKCNAGYTGADGDVCRECASGKYKAALGSATCTLCPAGKFSNFLAATGEGSCQACKAGSTSLAGSLTDENCFCNIGYTGPNGGTVLCTACAAGKFKSVTGSAACTQCAGGKYNRLESGTSMSDCINCGINTYSSADTRQCIACPSNSNSPAESSAESQCMCNQGHTG